MGLTMSKPVKRGETYHIRVRVPADVLSRVRGKMVSVIIGGVARNVKHTDYFATSLGTKDSHEAKRRHTEALASAHRYWEAVRSGPRPLDFKTSLSIAGAIRGVWVDVFDANPGDISMWEAVLEADKRAAEGVTNPLAVPTAETKRQALEGRYGPVTDAFLTTKGLVVDAGSRSRLLEQVSKAMTEMATVNLQKARGDYSDSGKTAAYPKLDLIDASEARGAKTNDSASLSFSAAIDRRVANKAGGLDGAPTRPETIKKFRRATAEFAEHRGSDDLTTVTSREAGDWKDAMLVARRLSNRTIRDRLTSVRTVVEWARKMSYGEFLAAGDPLDLVEAPDYSEIPSDLKAFTLAEARIVLTAAMAETKPELRWVPWLCAYSGARVNEMAQLSKGSLYQVEGIWFLRVTTMGGKALKNRYSERRVPVHKDLIEQGFLNFVNAAEGRADKRLFPPRTATNIGQWVRDRLDLKRSELMPNHGWRHLFEDRAMGSGISNAAKLYITGRATKTSDGGYGKSEAMLPGLANEMQKFPSYFQSTVTL